MVDPRYAIRVEDLVAGSRVTREEQVEVQTDPVAPPPAYGDPLRYGDGMSGDADGD